MGCWLHNRRFGLIVYSMIKQYKILYYFFKIVQDLYNYGFNMVNLDGIVY